jgi:hypothetical protein
VNFAFGLATIGGASGKAAPAAEAVSAAVAVCLRRRQAEQIIHWLAPCREVGFCLY